MPSEVILPRVDMDMATGKISKWLVAAGSTVSKGQPLFEIETDKAAMEIEANASGIVRTLVDASGQDIPVGSVVAWIYAEGEAPADAQSASARLPPAAGRADPERFEVEDRSFDSALPEEAQDTTASTTPGPSATINDRPRATPLARRLAHEHGLELNGLNGSGPRGRVQASDVEQAAERQAAEQATTVRAHASRAAGPAPARRAEAPQRVRPEAAPTPARVATGSLNIVPLREGRGTPVLLIHGWGADANTWRPFLSGQTRDRHVLGADLPGHGASPLGAVSSFDDLVDAMEAGLTAANLGAVHIVGHSLGAAVAVAVAARGTLDIRSLLLLSPAGLGPAINGSFLNGFLAASAEASLTAWMKELVADPVHITPAFVRATLKARAGTDLVGTQRQIAEAVFPDGTQAFSIRGDLARLRVQTRVVFGTADRIVPVAQATGLPGLIALHLFSNVGHMPQFEAREAVSSLVEQVTNG